LLPLNDPEHPDPVFCLRALTGKGRGTGILPRHGGCLLPVNVDHVTGEFVVVGTVIHRQDLIGGLAAGTQ
jgi:hypothetical protein